MMNECGNVIVCFRKPEVTERCPWYVNREDQRRLEDVPGMGIEDWRRQEEVPQRTVKT